MGGPCGAVPGRTSGQLPFFCLTCQPGQKCLQGWGAFSSPSLNLLLPLPNSGAAFPSVPVSKSPMVEQAVQTGSLDNLNAKKLLPGKGTVGVQLNGRPAPPSSKTASGTETPGPVGRAPCSQLFQMIASPPPAPPPPAGSPRLLSPAPATAGVCLTLPSCALDVAQPAAVQTQGQVNDENRRPPRRRSGTSRCHLSPEPGHHPGLPAPPVFRGAMSGRSVLCRAMAFQL